MENIGEKKVTLEFHLVKNMDLMEYVVFLKITSMEVLIIYDIFITPNEKTN